MYYIIEDFERKLFKVIIPLSVHLILGCPGKKKCEALGFPVSGRCPGRMVFFPRWTCTKVGRRKFKNCYRTTLENTFSGKITRSWPHRTDRQGKTIGKKIDSSSKIKKTTIWSLPVRWTKKKTKKNELLSRIVNWDEKSAVYDNTRSNSSWTKQKHPSNAYCLLDFVWDYSQKLLF